MHLYDIPEKGLYPIVYCLFCISIVFIDKFCCKKMEVAMIELFYLAEMMVVDEELDYLVLLLFRI